MIFGFNTDVKVGNTVFHVQTEDRGWKNPVIDTTVYVKGRILAKRGTSYRELMGAPDFDEQKLRGMLEEQHRRILEEVRAGKLEEIKTLEATAAGIQVVLTNPSSFLVKGKAQLQLAVKAKQDGSALADVEVTVMVRGAEGGPFTTSGKTDSAGLVAMEFPMPRLGPDGGELVIQATAGIATDEIKFAMRKKG